MTVYEPTDITASPYDQNLNPKRIDEDKINEVVFSDYGITPQAIKAYMYGIRVIDPDTGQEMPDSFYWQVINTQIDKVQKSLDIQILPMLNKNERHDYYENDASGYDHINTFSRPILQLDDFYIQYGNQPMLEFLPNWWMIYNLEGQVEVYPLNFSRMAAYGGSYPLASSYMYRWPMYPSYYNQSSAPQAYSISYVSGMLPPKTNGRNQAWEMPASLQELILLKALNQIFMVWGRLLGVGAGIAEKSLNIDGASQKITTTQSAMYTGSRADIDVINMQINELMASLKSYYGQGQTAV